MLTSRPVDRAGAFAILNGMFYQSARGALALLDSAESAPERWVGYNAVIQIQCRPSLGCRFLVRYAPQNHTPDIRVTDDGAVFYAEMPPDDQEVGIHRPSNHP